MTALALVEPRAPRDLVELVCDSVSSPASKKAYRACLTAFLAFSRAQGMPFARPVVNAFKAHLEAHGKKAQTVNQHLAAIKALAREARYAGAISAEDEAGIREVHSVKSSGSHCGRWLTIEEMRALLEAVGTSTPKGRRDYCIIGILMGCGLRRSELVNLNIGHLQRRGQRVALVDFIGKGNKTRTVIMPQRIMPIVEQWVRDNGGDADTPLIRSFARDGSMNGRMDESSVYWLLKKYSEPLGYDIGVHDLRRSHGRAALKGGADINDIRVQLGHSSLSTTSKYLGTHLDWDNPVADKVGL